MSLDQFVNLLVTIALLEMMMALGLGVTFADLASVARSWRLVAQGALANYVCVPAVTVVTRLRLDAALYDPAPPRAPGRRGRWGAPHSPDQCLYPVTITLSG